MRVGVFVAVLGWMLAAEAQADVVERESEIEVPASEAWQREGFRVQLRLGSGSATGAADAPNAGGMSFEVEPGVRLSRYWSLSSTLRYGAFEGGDFEALRWSTTADLSFHPWGGSFVAVGLGYAGVSNFGGTPVNCDGALALGRVGWLFALGPIFATGPQVQYDLQYGFCSVSSYEDDDGVFRRGGDVEWLHRTLQFAWSLAWR